VNTRAWLAALIAIGTAVLSPAGEVPEPSLPRPGSIFATEVTGEVMVAAGDQSRVVQQDSRLRVGSTVTTGRRSLATLLLSNGTTLQLGSDSELEIEEFGQAGISDGLKLAELKQEPTVSRTRLTLLRGDVSGTVKPLNIARGSSFTLVTTAGTLRLTAGTFRLRVQMSDLGLGVCTLALDDGRGEFQPVGSETFQPVPVGRELAFALERDKSTGAMKLGEMPKAKQ
jgi:hypothetical protein